MLLNKAHALHSICYNTLLTVKNRVLHPAVMIRNIYKPDLKTLYTRVGEWVGEEKGKASPE